MTYLTGEVSVIHNNTQVDFNTFAYSAVYANVASGGGGYTINGASILMNAGDTLEVVVQENTTVLNAGFVLLGNPIAVQTKVKTGLISGTTTQFQNNTGIVDTYQFVDINSGNPTKS